MTGQRVTCRRSISRDGKRAGILGKGPRFFRGGTLEPETSTLALDFAVRRARRGDRRERAGYASHDDQFARRRRRLRRRRPGSGFGNTAFQAGFTLVTEPQTAVGFRVGRLDLSGEERFGELTDAELDYAQVGGEYRFSEGYYESGLYLGLGGYRLRGDRPGERDSSETALGGMLGLLGDFALTRNLAIRVEVSGHYVLFDDARIFAMAQAGLAVRF
jgi:hypothetical protein